MNKMPHLPDRLTPEQYVAWLSDICAWLRAKRQREQAYLDRRAHHGVRTPTDEAYERDAVYEQALLALLEEELRLQQP